MFMAVSTAVEILRSAVAGFLPETSARFRGCRTSAFYDPTYAINLRENVQHRRSSPGGLSPHSRAAHCIALGRDRHLQLFCRAWRLQPCGERAGLTAAARCRRSTSVCSKLDSAACAAAAG